MIQAITVQAPAPAATPAAPAATIPPRTPTGLTIVGPDGTLQTLPIPLTRQDVADLRERRSELSNQLISAADRRSRLARELVAQPEGPARTGIEGRLAVLDSRLAQLETDIATTGRQLSAAPKGALTGSLGSPPDIPDNVMAISSVFTIFVLFPIAFALARNLWKRGTRASVAAPVFPAETGQRLERLEQGVEAIAIEIERVAEGQRFVTRLLSEGQSFKPGHSLKAGDEVRSN